MKRINFKNYIKKGGEIPTDSSIGIRESFWCGYFDIGGWRRGKNNSLQRRTYNAGLARSKVEPHMYPS